jgi:hypothetical protein
MVLQVKSGKGEGHRVREQGGKFLVDDLKRTHTVFCTELVLYTCESQQHDDRRVRLVAPICVLASLRSGGVLLSITS